MVERRRYLSFSWMDGSRCRRMRTFYFCKTCTGVMWPEVRIRAGED